MCTSPVTIHRPMRNGVSTWASLDLSALPAYVRKYLNFHSFEGTFPCGKCVECLKRRQNSLAVRAARCAEQYGSMSFVTLTYEDSQLPFAMKVWKVDSDTGEMLEYCQAEVLDRNSPMYVPLSKEYALHKKRGRKSIRYHYSPAGLPVIFEFTPSLNRRDVRLWLKRCRVKYYRETGLRLPDFKYLLLGEYGPNTCRPHYHVLFFGLSPREVSFFVSQWTFGFTYTENINAVNKDGSPGFVLAAKYVSKYVSKGRFECDSVIDRIAEKPRVCQSIRLGALDDSLIRYYRCEDVFPGLDIVRCRCNAGDLSFEDCKVLADLIKKRSTITVCGQEFPLPSGFIKKIWYEKINGKIVSSPLRTVLSSLARGVDLSSVSCVGFEESETFPDFLPDLAFYETNSTSLVLREKHNEEAFCKDLYSSIF